MNFANAKNLFDNFLINYNAIEKDLVWTDFSSKFRIFWEEKILKGNPEDLTDDEIDVIVRILDIKGKGNKKDDEAVARLMVPQPVTRRLFREFCSNHSLAEIITQILTESNPETKSNAIDKLYEINSGKRNNLTGPSGNFVNALLAAYNPKTNMSMISFQDRIRLMDYFEIPYPSDFLEYTIGKQFIDSNNIILNKFREIGINESARTISCFCYSDDIITLWKRNLTIKRSDKSINVSIPQDNDVETSEHDHTEDPRESIQIQALLTEIGSKMGFTIWLPRNDKARVIKCLQNKDDVNLLDELPLNYNLPVMKTIENIDVLWLKRGMVVRAFEVEHTTAVYSGILRMSDLLALLPNIDIKLHIVAPTSRLEKVLDEIKRPTFSLLERGAMSEICSYISYDNIRELSADRHLEYLSDTVLDEYCEWADNTNL